MSGPQVCYIKFWTMVLIIDPFRLIRNIFIVIKYEIYVYNCRKVIEILYICNKEFWLLEKEPFCELWEYSCQTKAYQKYYQK